MEIEEMYRKGQISRATFYRYKKGCIPIKKKNVKSDYSNTNIIIRDYAIKNPLLSANKIYENLKHKCKISRTTVWKKLQQLNLSTKEERLIAAFTLQELSQKGVINAWRKYKLKHTVAFPDDITIKEIKNIILPIKERSQIRSKIPIIYPGAISYISIRLLNYTSLKIPINAINKEKRDNNSIFEVIYFDEFSHYMKAQLLIKIDVDIAFASFLTKIWKLIRSKKPLLLIVLDFDGFFQKSSFNVFKNPHDYKPRLKPQYIKISAFLKNTLHDNTATFFDYQLSERENSFDKLSFKFLKDGIISVNSSCGRALSDLHDHFYKRTLRKGLESIELWQTQMNKYIRKSNTIKKWNKYCYGRSSAQAFKDSPTPTYF